MPFLTMRARLPFGIGHQDPRILGIFHEMGYTIVGWNADTYSGVAPGSGIQPPSSVTVRRYAKSVLYKPYG